MSMSNEIIPAVLPKNEEDLKGKFAALPAEPDIVHLDVLEEDIWADTGRNFEAHLMVAGPEEIAEKWATRGAKRLVVHKLGEKISALRGKVEIGLGVEMHVPLEEVFPLIPQVDFIQFMSIAEIGEQGHPLDERIFDRIKEVKEKFPQTPVSVDGGVNVSNYKKLADAGADRLVVGSGFKDLWTELENK